MRTSAVTFQPDVHLYMQRGMHQILNAVRPTLGPYPRMVTYYEQGRNRRPDLLDDGGLIARRISQLEDRSEDVGAMLIRQMLWQLRERSGDGTATAAVIFQTVFDHGLRFLSAGGDAMRLRIHLEAGMRLIHDQLAAMTLHIDQQGRQRVLTQVATGICHDTELAELMGEIFDIIGEHGALNVRDGRSRDLEREYVEGTYWQGGVLSRISLGENGRRVELENAAVMISDFDIDNPGDLIPVLAEVIKAEFKSLLLVADKISDNALGVLNSPQMAEKLKIVGVRMPGRGAELMARAAELEDLAVLTGGRALLKAGYSLDNTKLQDIGRTRIAWADTQHAGFSGAKGDPHRLRTHISSLRTHFSQARDQEERHQIRDRIGKLLGGSANLWIGGATNIEIQTRKEMANRTALALRGALMEGILPGGGIALLACRPELERRLADCRNQTDRAAYRALLSAVEAPARALLENGGHPPGARLADIDCAGPGMGFDLRSGQITDMVEGGIIDSAVAQKDAAVSAIASAALALTIDAVVHHKKPQVSKDP